MQEILKTTSEQLHSATGGKFDDISIILPNSWIGTDCAFEAEEAHLGDVEADFTVEAPHPIFGSEPYSEQFGQCGSNGRGVKIPFTALTVPTSSSLNDSLANDPIEITGNPNTQNEKWFSEQQQHVEMDLSKHRQRK